MFHEQDYSNQVRQVASQVLDTEVNSCVQLKLGKSHFVYLLETGIGKIIVKAFRRRTVFSDEDLPDHDKLLWVTDQLDKKGIPHQKILSFEPNHELLPGGFIIFRYIEGENAKELLDSGGLSDPEFFKLLGSFLKRVHEIKLPFYGSIDQKRRTSNNFADMRIASSMRSVDELSGSLKISSAERTKIEKVLGRLRDIKSNFSPVLVHGDPWPINSIVNSDGLVLIDWDEASSGIWLSDLANVTYISMALPERDERMLSKIENFMHGYGSTNLSKEEILIGVQALHMAEAINLCIYHDLHTKNMTEFGWARDKILSLLH